ncbi:MAG: hypothetical protein CSB22_00545 [Deltaproteobacteria bacterium]|nr:MAG: hypothetical protein CSB22_00545 [Deltaproteobacteria bacterium]
MKKSLLFLYLLSFMLCIQCLLSACDKEKAAPVRQGMIPPDPGALYLANDQPVKFNKYLGKPLVVLFFSNSCCTDELEKLETLVASSKQEELQVLGINVGDSLKEVERLGQEKRLSFPLAYDPILASKHRLRLMAIPTILIIGQDGKILGRIIGKISTDQLHNKILTKIKGGQ